MIKVCELCGREFVTNTGRQRFCNGQHFDTCICCGKLFEIPRSRLTEKDRKRTCSKTCEAAIRKATNMKVYGGAAPACSSEVQAKIVATNLQRFGTERPMQNADVQEKAKATNREKHGYDWYSLTDEMRKKLADKWANDEYKQRVRESIANSNLEKYGYTCILAVPEIREKAHDTYEAKTGYREPFANPEVRKKSEATLLKHYGVKNPLQHEGIHQAAKNTCLEKYGYENPMQSEVVKDKTRATCLARYGNTCFLQSDLGKQLTEYAFKQKYDSRWFSQSKQWKLDRMLDPSNIDNLMKFREDPKHFIESEFTEMPTIRQLAERVGISDTSVGQILIENNLQDSVAYVYSYMENEVYNVLLSIDSTLNIERNTHRVITPYELDLYLPDYKLGVECNPTATHNSSINAFGGDEPPLKYNYHQMKTQLCEDKGIFLFHIFGSEWTYSREIIVSMLRNLLGKNINKVYARQCQVKEVSAADCATFLNANHRQGNTNSPIRLGLFYNDELVSVMTFGKMRQSIGTDASDLSDCWELVRFCNKLNTSVVGGASKLFTYFVKQYQPSRIRSFSDRAHTRGNLYKQLGFTEVRKSDPGYVWVDSRTDISYHRYSAQKQNIKQFLHEDDIDLNRSEKQIMEEHGFLQVFDSGTILWEYIR